MKNNLFYCLLFTVFFFSCEKEENINNPKTENQFTEMNTFFESKVGRIDGEIISITVAEEDILSNAKKALKDTNLNLEPYKYEIFKDNNKNYLRILSKGNYVSTVELLKTPGGGLFTGGTVCTSVACASGGGCVPDGLYCTKCTPEDPTLAGDCTRSTSN